MTSNGYRYGVKWIALNDEPLDENVDSVAGYISTLLLADLFNKVPRVVAEDIVKFRKTVPEPLRQWGGGY